MEFVRSQFNFRDKLQWKWGPKLTRKMVGQPLAEVVVSAMQLGQEQGIAEQT